MSDLTLTYDELSDLLKRSPDATRQLVRRRRWRRMIGNDGKTRVVVPAEDLEAIRPPDVPPMTKVDEAPMLPLHTSDMRLDQPMEPFAGAHALIAVLETRISELHGRVAELSDELKLLRPKANHASMLEALLEIERSHASDLKNERDRLLDRMMTPVRPGLFGRLKRAISS